MAYFSLYLLCMAALFSFFSKLEAQTLTIKSTPSGPAYVKLGENLTLDVTYNYTGSRGVNVDWSKNNVALVRKFDDGSMVSFDKRASIKGEASFVLTNIELNDNGTYTVTLTAKDVLKTSVSRNVIVIVQVQPIAVINCSTNVTVKEGDSVQCLCNSTDGNPPPTASWYKDGKVVSGPENLKTNLSLKNISRNHTGSYSCVVESHDLNDTKSVEIQVQYEPQITSFNSDQENNISPVGKTVTITCLADAFPAPNYIIFHNRRKLTDTVDGVKTIQSANLSDDGRYECLAKNSIGDVSASFNLTVNVQPTAVISCSSNVTVIEGDDFNCLCKSTNDNPPPTASWYKDGKVVTGPGNLKKNLSFININRTDSGDYNCIVKSYNLSDTKSVKIQVHYKPKIASFISDQKNNISPVGKTVTITCVADAFPAPNYIIFHNGMEVTDVVDGVKTIRSANLNNDGRYECVASNSIGNVSASFNLTVNVPSEETSELSVGVIAAIAVGCGFFFILVVVLICCCCCKHDKCVVCCCCCKHMICGVCCRSNSKRERNENESEIDLADRGIANVSVVKENFNAYESVDKEKIKPNEEAGTSGDGEPARVDSPPSMPPVYAVVDKKSIKKKSPADERPASLTYASLDPVLLQPDSSKMRDRSREESNYADIDMAKLQNDKT